MNIHHIRREEVFIARYCRLSFIFDFGFHMSEQWCRSLLSTKGYNFNFTPILPYFQHGGMNLDHNFVQVWKINEDQTISK